MWCPTHSVVVYFLSTICPMDSHHGGLVRSVLEQAGVDGQCTWNSQGRLTVKKGWDRMPEMLMRWDASGTKIFEKRSTTSADTGTPGGKLYCAVTMRCRGTTSGNQTSQLPWARRGIGGERMGTWGGRGEGVTSMTVAMEASPPPSGSPKGYVPNSITNRSTPHDHTSEAWRQMDCPRQWLGVRCQGGTQVSAHGHEMETPQ